MKFSIFPMFIHTGHFRKFTNFNVSVYFSFAIKCGLIMVVGVQFLVY